MLKLIINLKIHLILVTVPKYEFEHLFIIAQPKNWTND